LLAFAVIGLSLAVAIATGRVYGDDPAGPEQAQPAKEQKAGPPALHLKVFRLTYRDPEEVQQILSNLLPETEAVAPVQMVGLAPGALMGGGAGLIGGPGAGQPGLGALGAGGGALGALGLAGGIGGGGPSWRLAVDARSRSLIVRGQDRDLQTAADLVAVLDLPPGKPIPQVKNLRAYKLQHADAEELSNVLSNLELDVRIVPVPGRNILVISGPEAEMKEVCQVIEELDVKPRSPEPAKEKGQKESAPEALQR
jgi:hypothetical protein